MSSYITPDRSPAPYIEPTPEATQPHVPEVGATSAPLKSAAFFIGAHCQDYNDDFMLCKGENRDAAHCLKEGRRVTRCAIDLLERLRQNCAGEFKAHWECLDNRNYEYYRCRKQERALNSCVFEKLGMKKVIPGTPQGQTPIHEVKKPIYKNVQK